MRHLRMGVALAAIVAAGAAMAADKVQVGEGKVFPESFAAGADGTLYAGSLTMGAIFKAAPGATKAESFIAKPADGPDSVVGVYADNKAGLLWACYSDLAAFAGQKALPAVARAYDMASGAEKGSYALPEGSFCNDITSTADGTVYVTDTIGARVMRLKPGATALETWVQDKSLGGVDGIAIGPDGKMVINNVLANLLLTIDIGADGAAGAVTPLKTSAPLKGPDGQRFGADGTLYLAENAAGQADAVKISGDTATITPLITGLGSPTAVDVVGDTLWVLEAKIDRMSDADENGPFWIIPVATK